MYTKREKSCGKDADASIEKRERERVRERDKIQFTLIAELEIEQNTVNLITNWMGTLMDQTFNSIE